jgi:Protein of unknown function (DUF551)
MIEYQHPNETCEKCGAQNAYIDYINDFGYICFECNMIVPKCSWIDIKEHLPWIAIDVLITNGSRISISYFDIKTHLWHGGNLISSEITHWMPLPIPPIFKVE